MAVASLILAGGVVGYLWFQGGSGEASVPITAPTISATSPATAVPTATVASSTAQAAVSPTPESTPTATAVATAPPAAASTPRPTEAATAAATTAATVATESAKTAAPGSQAASNRFRIDSAKSQVRFEIDEILRGSPNRVVGTTNEVAGEILLDLASPASSKLGTIRINVRTLRTDDSQRDRAIRSFVLESARSEYEFAEFKPKELKGLPASVSAGAPVKFQIVGDLTLRQVTAEVVFDATATVKPAEAVEGEAVAKIQRGTFKLTIPSVPSVASVGEEVVLGIKFFASAV